MLVKKKVPVYKIRIFVGCPKKWRHYIRVIGVFKKKEKKWENRPKNTFLADPGLIDFIRIYKGYPEGDVVYIE